MTFLFNIGFLNFRFIDAIDVLLVTFLLYQLYKLLRGTVAVKIFLGVLVIYLIYLTVDALGMELMSSIIGQFIGVGVLAAIIVFQQEIRRFLLLVGKTNPFDNKLLSRFISKKHDYNHCSEEEIEIILTTMKTLSATRTGALIVLPKSTELKFFSETGHELDAKLSKPLLLSIFNKESPLHDGAVIIKKGRISAASCIMPVSDAENLPESFGLRHRAAVGMTSETDAIVLIVSEETGLISLSESSKVEYNLSIAELRKKIHQLLEGEEIDQTSLSSFQIKLPSLFKKV